MSSLWKHQVEAINRALAQRDFALFFDAGTGKTRTTIEILRRQYAHNGRLMRTLIVCPKIVMENWKREFAMYSKISPSDVVVLSGTGEQRLYKFIKAVGEINLTPKIFIVNFEGLQIDKLYKLLTGYVPEILIVDESQRVKSHSSVRAKKLMYIADTTKHNYILTGTPVLNGSLDLFMQFRILDRGQTFGRNYYAYKNTYFIDANAAWASKPNHFPKWEMRAEAVEALQDKISPKSMRALKSQCLDLPPFVRQEVFVELSAEQKKLYAQMKNDYIAFLDSRKGENVAVTANLAITKALRLQQIVSGFVKDDHEEIHRVECPRLAVLGELLEDLTPASKVIVWCVFKENYRMIEELCVKLKIKYAMITGDNSSTREEDMQRFREEADCRVMIANQSAGGVGINLIESNYSIYYSKGFSLEHDLQSEARNYRGGSHVHEKVTRIDLIAKDTIDEYVNMSLKNKENIAQKILSWKEKL